MNPMATSNPSDFEIRLERGNGAPPGNFSKQGAALPAQQPDLDLEGPCRHYAVVLPSHWKSTGPLRVNNVDLAPFKKGFQIQWPWPGKNKSEPSRGLFLNVDGLALSKPEAFLNEISGWITWTQALELLNLALSRRLDRNGFVAALDRLDLPVDWRNGLVNDLFLHAAPTPKPSSPSPSDLDHLLTQVALPEGEKSGTDQALDHFIDSVASGPADTGFKLDEDSARQWIVRISELKGEMHGTFLSSPQVAEEFGYLASLNGLARAAKGRKRHWLHFIPENLSEAEWNSWIISTAADEPGPWEVIAFPHPKITETLWPQRIRKLGAKAFLQIEASESNLSPEFIEKWADIGFAFVGGVLTESSGQCLTKPATWVALHSLLLTGDGFNPEGELRYEEDIPYTQSSTAHGADRLRTTADISDLRRLGINPLIGTKNSLEVFFAPLISLSVAFPQVKATHG
jgi:hypothetical protein